LIDGLHGTTNWRTGSWQGYQAQNFECVVDLGKEKEITSISSNYLQDTRAWIVFPKKVEYFISQDGINFESIGLIVNTVDAKDDTVSTKDFTHHLTKKSTAKFVKIVATNFGKLPEWHAGKGGEAFIFIDELDIK